MLESLRPDPTFHPSARLAINTLLRRSIARSINVFQFGPACPDITVWPVVGPLWQQVQTRLRHERPQPVRAQ